MSWMQRLCETYDNAHNKVGDYNDDAILLPLYHTTMTCNIEVTLNENGEFVQAKPSEKKKIIIIPCTESSAGRSGDSPKAHPLSDKLQYIAGDFSHYGGEVTSGFKNDPEEPFRQLYQQLTEWSEASPDKYKLRAVKRYLEKKRLIEDLIEAGVLHLDEDRKLLKKWDSKGKKKTDKPPIFESITNVNDATVGWHVEKKGEPTEPLWKDKDIHKAWQAYYESRKINPKLCFISGRSDVAPAEQHPKKILQGASNAKLISSNDKKGFTFRGRFTTAEEACTISAVASQKMHNALSWLVERQGYNKGTLNIVAWAVSGGNIPDPMKETAPYDYDDLGDDYNAAQAFGLAFKKRIAGYRARISSTDSILVLAFDAATSGRASLTYYRELTGSDFLDRLERWYARHEWLYSKPEKKRGFFIQVRSPEQIAKDIYEHNKTEDKEKKTDDIIRSVVQRLLPCIIDGQKVPFDLVVAARNRASKPMSFKKYKEDWKNREDWENTLSTACALFRGYYYTNFQEEYSMSLDPNRTTRDYLYGRLLAVAESLEKSALGLADEGRSSTAERYMQQFAERPFNTWKTIELSLSPYIARLQSNAPGLKKFYTDKLDEIHCLFNPDDFENNEPLTGEFLLGYHCQRLKNYEGSSKKD
uniref:CRISPR-associated protein, Csd1 family n=1 Tax=Chlorobium chlorochromatii (strain CaD3) TaxID=340177 RepID=Q3ARV5_CHLCH